MYSTSLMITHGAYNIVHHPKVVKEDIPRLDSTTRERIHDAIRSKLGTEPYLFGRPLRQSLKGCRALRVEDYRVIYRILKQTVRIEIIGHRSIVYEDAPKRL